jgi:hypothetical protein
LWPSDEGSSSVTNLRHLAGEQDQSLPRTAALASRLHYGLAMNRLALSALFLGCFSFGALGCSATTASAPHSPSVAFAASASDVLQSCTPEGTPRVVATHVSPRAGLAAVAEGGQIKLHFATARSPLATTLDAGGLDIVKAEAAPAAVAANAAQGPADVELPDHRHLVAWTEGTTERGMRVRVRTVGADGSSEAPIDFAYDGSAIGQPAVAVTRAGSGVVAFIESTDDGFQVVAARMTCAIP